LLTYSIFLRLCSFLCLVIYRHYWSSAWNQNTKANYGWKEMAYSIYFERSWVHYFLFSKYSHLLLLIYVVMMTISLIIFFFAVLIWFHALCEVTLGRISWLITIPSLILDQWL
jgi:hypothetical protein